MLPEINGLGATLVVISPQIQRTQREPEDQKPLGLEHLRDQGNEIAKRYGLSFDLPADLIGVYRGFGLDLEKANGSWTLPMPAPLVIDRSGVLRSRDVDPHYTRRTEPAGTGRGVRSLGR